jgi:hypothetical protein
MAPRPDIEDRLAKVLLEMPDPLVDLRAARATLRERTVGARARRARRVGLVAVACTLAALLAVAGLARIRSALDDQTMVADRLASGLPIGMIEGSVYYLDPGPHRASGRYHFRFVVKPDGTGTYSPPRTDGVPWKVRFVGETPGHVDIVRDDVFCGRVTDLALDFRVHGNSVTVTRAVFDPCTRWPTVSGTDLAGETLRWVPKPLAPR